MTEFQDGKGIFLYLTELSKLTLSSAIQPLLLVFGCIMTPIKYMSSKFLGVSVRL